MSIDVIPYIKGFHEYLPVTEILTRDNIGAVEEAYVDLSARVPKPARFALILVEFYPYTIVTADALSARSYLYDNLVDYNVYGLSWLEKAAAEAQVRWRQGRIQFILPLTGRKYAYDISGIFNANRVALKHWLAGYFM